MTSDGRKTRAQQGGFFDTDFVGNFGNGPVHSTFEIDFTHSVSGAAFELVTNPNTTTFEALLNGTVVGQFSASTTYTSYSYYGFDGITFDTLRVAVGGDGAMLLDNIEFRSAVPEPTSLALMGLGLAALALRARRKA